MNERKCIVIVDEAQPAGIIANAAACLAFSLGSLVPEHVGPDQYDADGGRHGGLTGIPFPILRASAARLVELVDRAYATPGLAVYDMSDVAQSCKAQDEYRDKLAGTRRADLRYWALMIYGERKLVNQLGGGLPLYRG